MTTPLIYIPDEGEQMHQPVDAPVARLAVSSAARLVQREQVVRHVVTLCHRLGSENVELLAIANAVSQIAGDPKWPTRAIYSRLKVLRSFLDDAIRQIEPETR